MALRSGRGYQALLRSRDMTPGDSTGVAPSPGMPISRRVTLDTPRMAAAGFDQASGHPAPAQPSRQDLTCVARDDHTSALAGQPGTEESGVQQLSRNVARAAPTNAPGRVRNPPLAQCRVVS